MGLVSTCCVVSKAPATSPSCQKSWCTESWPAVHSQWSKLQNIAAQEIMVLKRAAGLITACACLTTCGVHGFVAAAPAAQQSQVQSLRRMHAGQQSQQLRGGAGPVRADVAVSSRRSAAEDGVCSNFETRRDLGSNTLLPVCPGCMLSLQSQVHMSTAVEQPQTDKNPVNIGWDSHKVRESDATAFSHTQSQATTLNSTSVLFLCTQACDDM